MKLLALAALCLALGGISAQAAPDGLVVAGRIVDEARSPIADAAVSINSRPAVVNENGEYQFVVDSSEPLLIDISADGYYRVVHTVHQSDFAAGSSRVADIELVSKAAERRMLVFAGDAMLARRYFEPLSGEPALVRRDHVTEDGQNLLRPIKPYIELADYASVNHETQLSSGKLTQPLAKSVTFYSPTELASVLSWAGFDYVALGNNHTWDYQDKGLASTTRALDEVQLAYSGAGMNEAEARQPHIAQLDGQPFGFLSYVGWAGTFSPSQAADGTKGGAALGGSGVFKEDLQNIPDSTVSVLQYHSGLEYSEAPAMSERMRLREAVDRGADIALGHHSHVVQGFEVYKNRLVAYSLGNFLFDQYHYTTQLGMLLYVWMDGEDLHRAEVVPMNINGYVPTPATGRFRYSVLNRLARLSRPYNTCLRENGAHAIVESCNKNAASDFQVAGIGDIETRKAPVHLAELGLSPLTPAAFKAEGQMYRLGTDILRRGDFESSGLHGTSDRTWLQNEAVSISNDDSQVLRIQVPQNEVTRTGMKVFERVFAPSNPTTVRGRFHTNGAASVQFLLQRRRMDDGLREALDSGPTKAVGGLRVTRAGWHEFSFDFDQPRVSTRSVRLLIDVRDDSGRNDGSIVLFDDLAWVEWRTPWLGGGDAASDAAFATHVQFGSNL
ncbi:MAG: CapA family protein [Gammaproteobacteria bacterium]|nr:CapA family protein [Gammaproteobacteria bacterium]MDH3415341.1 CapA family protein [Gammaproteobacteria bacterium]